MFKDRVTIITTKLGEPDFLGDRKEIKIRKIVPCRLGNLTHNQQMGIFGSYNNKAFKLHLQGHYEEIKEVTYKDVPRQVKSATFHRNSTVLVIE